MFDNLLLFTRSALSVSFFAFLLLSMSLVQTVQLVHAPSDPPVIVMEDTLTSTGWGIYSTRPVLSEYVSGTSVLVGKLIDSITVSVKKSSSSASGTAQVGIINPDLSIKKLFASFNISTLTTSYAPTTFTLASGDYYTIQAGDRIGIKYTGPDGNHVSIQRDTDTSNSIFDGTNTYLSYYTTSWTAQTTYDLTMTLKYYGGGIDTTPPTVTASPTSGIFNTAQMVTLTSNEQATTIYYTLDGTTPTTSSSVYSSAISVSATATLKFFGVDTAGNAGSVISETYTIDSVAPTVTASPLGGTYSSVQSVTLDSDESGTVIYYTTNGANPSTSSPVYTSAIQLASITTLKFFGKDAAGNFGSIVTETYVIDTTGPAVTALPPGGSYNTAQSVTLTADEAATIYYTTDGTIPTTSSPVYSTPFLASDTTTLRFYGVDVLGNAGVIATEEYTIDMVAPTVTASPAGGTYSSAQSVILSSSESGTTIRYTIDGSEPSDSSPTYTSPIELSSDTILNFFGKDAAGNSGTVGSESYFITLPDTTLPSMSASPTGGTFGPSGTSVELTANEPSTIYYTTDNSVPDTSSSIYTSPLLISADTTLKFFGIDTSGNSGSIGTEVYTIDSIAPTVTASPAAGSYTSSQSITLSASKTGTTIYYTLDGSDPEYTSPVYGGPITLNADVTLKFYGIDLAGNIGPITTEVYDFEIASIPQPDGVVQIYPTKLGGDEWYINMDNPAADPRFKPKVTITKNTDGSWKAKSSQVRANVFTVIGYSQVAITTYNQMELAEKGYMQSPNDWKNVEVTGYIKVNAFKKDDNFSWYARGGMHTNTEGCEGTAYKGNLYYSGKVRFAKEQWHSGGYSYTTSKTVTDPIKLKWVGLKFVMYNTVVQQGTSDITGVKLENWIDVNNDGNWIKVDEKQDVGGWGDEGDHCGGNPDQIITWGGPVVTFRWDNTTDVDFKNFSVREIAPPQ
jgi:hypothetical protein